jgi:site-specific recombinase XerD
MSGAAIDATNFIENIKEYIKRDSAHGRPSQDTLNTYMSNINQFLQWCNLEARIHPLAAVQDDIKEYRNYLWENRQLRVSTVSLKLTAIRRFYDSARLRQLVELNPCDGIFAGEDPLLRATGIKYLNETQLQNLISLIPATGVNNLRARLIIAFMALQGLRTVEIHRASVEDIDLDHGIMIVRGKKRDGRIYLRVDTLALLLKYLKIRGFAEKDERGTPLFLSTAYHNKFGRLSRCGIRDIVDFWFKQAGIKQENSKMLSCHLLRHSCGTNLYLRTKDLRIVQEVLRHKKIDTTTKYSHIEDQLNKRYTELIPLEIL